MENKVENINIEKNKELFEYEMTEVILKLKGEFAAFSGKDTRFADMVVDDAKLRINTSEVVQVQRENHHIETPAIGSVQQTEAARVEVKETILQLPVIPQISDEGGRKEKKAYNTETRRKQIQFQETHSFKCEIKKPTVVKAVTTVPELKHIQTYNVDDVSIEHQAIVVPDVPKCNSISKNVDLKSAKASVSLPRTNISKQMSLKSIEVSGNDAFRVPSIPVVKKVDIPDIQDKNNTIFVPYKKAKAFGGASNIVCDMTPFAVCIPAVSFKKPKTLSPRKVEKHNMAIPIASPPRFSEMVLVEHERSSTEIEIHPVKVNGNLGKVRISHYGTIAIPQKPEVKETVDNIIALAVAKS